MGVYAILSAWIVAEAGLHDWYFSQAGQDRYLDERIFKNKRNGTFVEIGSYDGWMGSNCVFFEKVRDRTGLVVRGCSNLNARKIDLPRQTKTPPVLRVSAFRMIGHGMP